MHLQLTNLSIHRIRKKAIAVIRMIQRKAIKIANRMMMMMTVMIQRKRKKQMNRHRSKSVQLAKVMRLPLNLIPLTIYYW